MQFLHEISHLPQHSRKQSLCWRFLHRTGLELRESEAYHAVQVTGLCRHHLPVHPPISSIGSEGHIFDLSQGCSSCQFESERNGKCNSIGTRFSHLNSRLATQRRMCVAHTAHHEPCELQPLLQEHPTHHLHHGLIFRLAHGVIYLKWHRARQT